MNLRAKCGFPVFLSLSITFSAVLAGAQQILLTPSTLSFGYVNVGSSKTQSIMVKNTTKHRIGIFQANVSGTGYTISGISCPIDLRAGQSMSFSVTYAPASPEVDNGLVSLVTDNWWKTSRTELSTSVLTLSGSGFASGVIAASPTSLLFGDIQVGSSASLSETLTNTGGSTVNISQSNVAGTGFSVTGLTVPTALTTGQSVTFVVNFAPVSGGAASGNLAILSDASNSTLNIGLSAVGTAPGQLSASPSALNFGNVAVGNTTTMNGSLNATGASVTVSSGSSDSSEFVLSGITFPKTIAAGQAAAFTVTFTPNASGTASGNLTFMSDASNSPTVETLTGNGQAPQPHSVALSWNASQSPGVVGYNIYRRAASGSYSNPINTSLDANTTYTDDTVTAGQTYFYVAKAVDGNDVESGPSAEVQATVPSP